MDDAPSHRKKVGKRPKGKAKKAKKNVNPSATTTGVPWVKWSSALGPHDTTEGVRLAALTPLSFSTVTGYFMFC